MTFLAAFAPEILGALGGEAAGAAIGGEAAAAGTAGAEAGGLTGMMKNISPGQFSSMMGSGEQGGGMDLTGGATKAIGSVARWATTGNYDFQPDNG